MFFLLIILVFTQLFTAGAVVYLLVTRGRKKNEEVRPYSQVVVGGAAFGFALVVIFLFFFFVADEFEISANMGQVGDFIGGLTNPILSFVALIVLLRTTLIQTSEARKTAEILLEQQKLLEEERFEAGFYALQDRLNALAEKNLRVADERGHIPLKVLRESLVDKRDGLSELQIRHRFREARKEFIEQANSDKYKLFAISARRLFHYIDDSKIGYSRKKYYVKHFMELLEPAEQILFLEVSLFHWSSTRRRLRKYRPAALIRPERFMLDVTHAYYCKRLELVTRIFRN